MADETIELHGLDTETHVFFYEHDYYCLSNFSAFRVRWRGIDFDTAEHVYHWEKFPDEKIRHSIFQARSAHEALQIAREFKEFRFPNWDSFKVSTMRDILWAKVGQHEYVMRKLLLTGERMLVEDSWRDDFWGWGPNRDGQNALGKLWMDIRDELRRQVRVA